MFIGYARVSTTEQNLDSQIEQLTAFGCKKIYQEKISGKEAKNRPELQRMLIDLKKGDTLVVTRTDRLARSTLDLLTILKNVGDRDVRFKSMLDEWADTTTASGRMVMTFISGVSEFERELISARTSAGRARALARGVKFGRKLKLTPHQRIEALQRKANGEGIGDIAKLFNVHHSMISRLR